LRYLFLFFSLLLISCQNDKKQQSTQEVSSQLNLKYAEGFSVRYFKDYTELSIDRPWPNATRRFKYALVKNGSQKETLSKSGYDGIIEVPVQKVVVTSTTHIPALDLLGQSNSLVGFPGCDYISSYAVRKRIDQGLVREIGQNQALNTEVLLSLQPDLLIGFGIDGVNKAFETVSNAGIPVIYNGDWAESTALAKAEWIKFFGVLYGQEEHADSIFSKIESDYLSAKALAKKATTIPTVLSGAMYEDLWYLPHGTSPEGQFLKDANLNYLWKESDGSGSLALSFESVLLKAKEADIWINPSHYTSYEQLASTNALYTNFSAFEKKSIFSMSLTKGATGGVLYYELGSARPDLVLKDLIKLGHPELLQEYQSTFFKPLADGEN
jgi:iron complex transport system substrate-binding protein